MGHRLHWRSVFGFTDSVRDHTIGSVERQELVAQSLLQLFKGDAQTWYHQLNRNSKDEMAIDLEHALTMVEDRFKMHEADALALLDKAVYTMEDVKTDKSFRTWALDTIRLCRAYGMTTRVQQMSQLYNKTYPGLRQIIIRPNAPLRFLA